jgi:hypothetical protein
MLQANDRWANGRLLMRLPSATRLNVPRLEVLYERNPRGSTTLHDA